MRKASISLYILTGLVIIMVLAFVFSRMPDIEPTYPDGLENFQEYFNRCSEDAIILSNSRYGFLAQEYDLAAASSVDSCMQEYLASLQERGFKITKGQTSAAREINENTIIVTIRFPCEIASDKGVFFFKDYTKTFYRISYLNLNNVKDKPFFSADGNLKLEFYDNIKLRNLYGDEIEEVMIVRLEDKREKNGEELDSNLIYGMLPTQYVSEKPFKISFYAQKLVAESGIPLSDLRIMEFNPNSGKWGVLDTTLDENGYLTGTTSYTTYYGIMSKFDPITMPGASFGPWDDLPMSTIEAPPPDFSIITEGEPNEIFEKIRQEMGGPWPLVDNPACAEKVVSSPAYCAAAWHSCGNNAVYCLPDTFKMSIDSQNLLFRHEITHSIQFMNDLERKECPQGSPNVEWGAEFYSDTQCYLFKVGSVIFTARQLGEKMKELGSCTDDMLMDAAFCKPGSYAKLWDTGCLLADYQQLADETIPIDCKNI